MAIAMAGTPLALPVGIPAGTALGTLAGWRVAFAALNALAALLAGWMVLWLPDFAGADAAHGASLRQVLLRPGIRPVLLAFGATGLVSPASPCSRPRPSCWGADVPC